MCSNLCVSVRVSESCCGIPVKSCGVMEYFYAVNQFFFCFFWNRVSEEVIEENVCRGKFCK